jgi:ABC-type uncharacterized transport system auxiliary subunit
MLPPLCFDRRHRFSRLACSALALALMCACTEAPTWQKLLSLKITEQFPDYKVQFSANGGLLVERPGKSTLPVDADAIGKFCQRGPKDCNYATDQMLLELGGK